MVGFCNFGEVKFKFESLDAVGLDCKCQLVARKIGFAYGLFGAVSLDSCENRCRECEGGIPGVSA